MVKPIITLPDDGLPMPRRLLAVISITTGSVLYTLDGSITNVALPVIANKLHIAAQTAVLLTSTYNLVLAMLLLPLAAVGEHFGHRRVFTAGLLFYLAASLGCFFAPSFGMLLCFRALQAVAAAGLLSVALAMVRMVYPASALGRGLGFNTLMSALGSAAAAPLGGWITANVAWQAVFVAALPLALAGLATVRALPDPEPHDAPYDRKGALLCAITFGMLIASLQALSQGAPGWLAGMGLAVGVAVAVVFVRHERGIERPVLPVDLLARPAMALSVASGLLAILASTILLVALPFRLHDMGFGVAATGAVLGAHAATVLLVAPTSGMLSDKVPATYLGTAGLALGTAALLLLASLPAHAGSLDISWRLVVCALGFSLFFSPNGRLVVGAVSRQRAAGASSLLATTRMFGQALGATAVAGFLALKMTPAVPTRIAAGLAFAGFVCSAARIFIHADAPDR